MNVWLNEWSFLFCKFLDGYLFPRVVGRQITDAMASHSAWQRAGPQEMRIPFSPWASHSHTLELSITALFCAPLLSSPSHHNTVALGIRASTYDFWGWHNIQSKARTMPLPTPVFLSLLSIQWNTSYSPPLPNPLMLPLLYLHYLYIYLFSCHILIHSFPQPNYPFFQR